MFRTHRFVAMLVVLAASLAFTVSSVAFNRATTQPATLAAALNTAFTYQGQLQDNGAPANGSYDFQFILYDAPVGGAQVSGSPIVEKTAVAVTNGLFTVQLDFGDVFGNAQFFLDISVRPAGGSSYTPLTPRQELTPAPFARYALNAQNAVSAQNAVNAQSVPWSGVTGKPAAAVRQIVVPGNAMSYSPSAAITSVRWGTSLANNAAPIGFAVPQPTDWDKTQPFTVTLHFALPSAPSGGTLRWRLQAGSTNTNLPAGSADSGWDSLDFSQNTDAAPLSFATAPGRFNIMKTQSWQAQFSSQFNTWYLGTGVTTNNDFGHDPIWQFSFQRGNGVANGEDYTGALIVVAAEVSYVAK